MRRIDEGAASKERRQRVLGHSMPDVVGCVFSHTHDGGCSKRSIYVTTLILQIGLWCGAKERKICRTLINIRVYGVVEKRKAIG